MAVVKSEVRAGAYFDSVVLMQLQRGLAELPGVIDAGVVMATPANRELLAASDLTVEEEAGSDDLLIVVRADNSEAATEALQEVDSLLASRRSRVAQAFRPRSLGSAVELLPQAKWVLISVPGRYAAGVAREALRLNRHVFLYSDNVLLADEVALKDEARRRRLLLMGPDCGTAIISGIGLGFANRVRRGSIGLVAASGTGLQAVASAIHLLGGGVSQAIGTGGRDMKAEVGAITSWQALDLLGRDPDSQAIVLVSKPPENEVVAGVMSLARQIEKPIVIHFIGYTPPARQLGNLHFAVSLQDAAELAIALVGSKQPLSSGAPTLKHGETSNGFVRGLFSGGTLAYEALLGFQAALSPIYSNIPFLASHRLPDDWHSQGHTIIDLGEDEFTQGRLHPMIDNDLRLRRFRQEATDPEVSVILLDVVLGEGSHPDPADELAPEIAEALRVRGDGSLEILVVLIGTDEDPQNLEDQAARLDAAGAIVYREIGAAVAHVSRLLGKAVQPYEPVALSSLSAPFQAVNVGLESFYDSLIGQGAEAVQVDWRPPAGGNERLMDLLAKLKS